MALILLNKPFRVLSQFRDADRRATLAEFVTDTSVYPAGRLDFDSEGLLLLTDDGKLQSRIGKPGSKVVKCYWAQVEGTVGGDRVERLLQGVPLKDGHAAAHAARPVDEPAGLWPREPPIRERWHIPTSWIDLCLTEGRNRQVRRMTAAVGLPVLRLIRHRVGPWSIGDLQPGASRRIETTTAWQELDAYFATPLAR